MIKERKFDQNGEYPIEESNFELFSGKDNVYSSIVEIKTKDGNKHYATYNITEDVFKLIPNINDDSVEHGVEGTGDNLPSENVETWKPYLCLTTLVDELQGTCKSLDEACETQHIDCFELNIDELGKIDNEIFNCAECGWWCEISEQAEDGDDSVCVDCCE
ncbi:hypothetical protein BPT24_111 [Tenacibaculum phage pT24]|uniref:Uncharacterized protein n=1 Tax=Tenacibaculum phage pT24 TaxID=1880590 RepID=A0A1B4XWQ3_9CAUD|nr:hypothetical protein HYP10_gp111 [Tenacibaculum phage pT24]BAV39236.1 hypothetical protein BPT24_111 [Tenacibaculum phage pT24]